MERIKYSKNDGIYIQIGCKASGKTEYLKSPLRKKREKKTLILDINNEYVEYEKTTVKEFSKLGNVIRRISFEGLDLNEAENLYMDAIAKTRNAIIFAEDWHCVLSSANARKLESVFCSPRTRGLQLYLGFHSLCNMRAIIRPRSILNVDYFICHRVNSASEALGSDFNGIFHPYMAINFYSAFMLMNFTQSENRCVMIAPNKPDQWTIIKRPKPKGEQPHKILSVSKIAKL